MPSVVCGDRCGDTPVSPVVVTTFSTKVFQAARLGRAPGMSVDHRGGEQTDEREDRRRGRGGRGHSPLVGGSLARRL